MKVEVSMEANGEISVHDIDLKESFESPKYTEKTKFLERTDSIEICMASSSLKDDDLKKLIEVVYPSVKAYNKETISLIKLIISNERLALFEKLLILHTT